MNWKKSKFSLIFRIIALMLIQAFLFVDVIWAANANLSPRIRLDSKTVKKRFVFLQVKQSVVDISPAAGLVGKLTGSFEAGDVLALGLFEGVRFYLNGILCSINSFMRKSSLGDQFDMLISQLSGFQTNEMKSYEMKSYLLLKIVRSWRDELGEKRLNVLLGELVSMYYEDVESLVEKNLILKMLALLSRKSEFDSNMRRVIIDIAKKQLESNIERFTANSRELSSIERAGVRVSISTPVIIGLGYKGVNLL